MFVWKGGDDEGDDDEEEEEEAVVLVPTKAVNELRRLIGSGSSSGD